MSLRVKYGLILSGLMLSSCAPISLLRKSTSGKVGVEKEVRNLADHSKINTKKSKKITLKEVKVTKKSSVDEIKEAENKIVEVFEEDENSMEVQEALEDEPVFTLDYKEKHFKFWVNYFEKRENARFLRHIKNGERFKSVVEKVFEEEGLPKDLFYVGLIESGYNTHIRSHASAVGPWQFIKGTAKRYGLRVDASLDERRSIHKATYAAASYFKDLYNIFGSWELALCAYNAGEYRIINAIRKGNTRDYKELVQKKLLPKETIFYIPKVAAAKYLIEKKKMGERGHSESSFYQNAVSIEMDKSFSLSKFAKRIGVNYSAMKKLNPDTKKDWVGSVRRRSSFIFVPKKFKAIAQLKALSLKNKKVASGKTLYHKVRRGDNLSHIASRYKTSVSRLKELNALRKNRIYIGQRLKVSASRLISSVQSQTSRGALPSFHRVKRGENLSLIAKKYNTSVKLLRKINAMRTSKILVNQKIKIKPDNLMYTVKKGDNLYRIAQKHGLSVKKIVQVNSLKGKTIHPKQRIILPI